MEMETNRRILLIDDNPSIHEDYRKILTASDEIDPEGLQSMEAVLFGGPRLPVAAKVEFQLESASQGQEGLQKLTEALRLGKPYAAAFVDMRMPPGWDGLETIQHLWEVDPTLQIIICTAYSDRSWTEIRQALGNSDRVLILKKPFDSIEVLQCACTMTEKWTLMKLANLRTQKLEEMVNERTRDLLATAKQKNDFLANMSHELLTPMNGIMGGIEALQVAALDTEANDLCQMIRHSGNRLLSLLQDVLDFNAMAAGRVSLEEGGLSFEEIVKSVQTSLAETIHGRELRFESHVDAALPQGICGDEGRIRQILFKLADNAVKFTEKGSIELRVALISITPDRCTIECSVRDTGPGLPPEVQRQLTTSFIQGDSSSTRAQGGVGMGLTLAQGLLELMQSSLIVESESGKGSTFRFRLGLSPCGSRGSRCRR